jgi:anthranilate phosphoribosyltransferase
MFPTALGRLSAGHDLSLEEMDAALEHIMSGQANQGQIGVFLVALAEKGETSAELAGAARCLRRHMTRIRSPHEALVDTCGTGGDNSQTFNISTTAAVVTAAAGLPVAKHGNRSVTSRSGSADVLAALGVNLEAEVATVERCLAELGLCFCFAPALHPAMKQVAAVRRSLGRRTIFNLIGPLCNPAGAPFQVLGTGRLELQVRLAEALRLLGTRRALVVCGHGLGEVNLARTTTVIEVTPRQFQEFSWTAADFGLPRGPLEPLAVSGPEESAAVVRRVLEGEAGPARDIVLANAAAALCVAGRAAGLREGVAQAAMAIDTGAALRLLERLVAMSHER